MSKRPLNDKEVEVIKKNLSLREEDLKNKEQELSAVIATQKFMTDQWDYEDSVRDFNRETKTKNVVDKIAFVTAEQKSLVDVITTCKDQIENGVEKKEGEE